jgi:hypothetical protein
MVAHDAFVVILAEDKKERVRRYFFSDVTQSDACPPLSLCPDISTCAAFAKLQRSINNSQLGVDLQRTRLHSQRSGFNRWPSMSVNDEGAYTASNKLIGKHKAGWAGPDDKNIGVHLSLQCNRILPDNFQLDPKLRSRPSILGKR